VGVYIREEVDSSIFKRKVKAPGREVAEDHGGLKTREV